MAVKSTDIKTTGAPEILGSLLIVGNLLPFSF